MKRGQLNGQRIGVGTSGADDPNAYSFSDSLQAIAYNTYFSAASTGGGGAHNNLPPYITLNYIIKF